MATWDQAPVEGPSAPDAPGWSNAPAAGPSREARLKAAEAQILKDRELYNPTSGNGFWENAAIGAGKSVYDTGRGLGQLLRGVLPTKVADAISLPTQEDIDEAARLDKPVMETGGGIIGNIGGQVTQMALPAYHIAKLNQVRNAGAALTAALPRAAPYINAAGQGALFSATQPVLSDQTRAGNAATGGAFGAAGQAIGQRAGAWLRGSLQRGADDAAANAVRDASLAGGRELGMAVTPTQAGAGGAVNSLMEMLGGKIKLQQSASIHNQGAVNAAARQALGLPPNTPITQEMLSHLRQQAGGAYGALRGVGNVATDPAYIQAIDDIARQYQGANASFPGLARADVDALVASMRQPGFTADAAVDAMRVLRESADDAFRRGETGLGRANRAASTAVEDMLERHLQASNGNATLLQRFRDARRQIARTYTVQDALAEGAGNVSLRKLGAAVQKGEPLDPTLAAAGRFANAFPQASQAGVNVPAYSVLDGAGAATALYSGNIPMAAGIAARPIVRSTVLSAPYQQHVANPNYGPGITARNVLPLLETDIGRRFMALTGLTLNGRAAAE